MKQVATIAYLKNHKNNTIDKLHKTTPPRPEKVSKRIPP